MMNVSRPRRGLLGIAAALTFAATSAMGGPLGSGVNLPVWPVSKTKIDAEDLSQIASSGFAHVRLPVDIHRMLDAQRHLDRTQIRLLRDQVIAARRAGLFVIIDAHPPRAFKDKVNDGQQTQIFLTAWRDLSGALRDLDSSVAFEILNEPGHKSHKTWWRIQADAIREIRRTNPNRILIASAPGFSTVEDLVAQVPYRDRNIIYVFHFYRPEKFTHQGAAYSSWYRDSGNIPYPGLGWDRDRVNSEFDKVSRWAKHHRVDVICTEFGVYVPGPVKPQDRLTYFSDVSHALRARGIDWTVWKYTGDYGLAQGEPRRLDADAVRALGLTPRVARSAQR